MNSIGIEWDISTTVSGEVIYGPRLIASDGSHGVYVLRINGLDQRLPLLERSYTLLAAAMPKVDHNFVLWIRNWFSGGTPG